MPPPRTHAIELDNTAIRTKASLRWEDQAEVVGGKTTWISRAFYNEQDVGTGTGSKKGVARDAAAASAFEEGLVPPVPPRQQITHSTPRCDEAKRIPNLPNTPGKVVKARASAGTINSRLSDVPTCHP